MTGTSTASETYVYVMGINPACPIRLSQGILLEPSSCHASYENIKDVTTSRGGHSELDYALAIATLKRTYAQIRFDDDCGILNSKRAEYALWWCVALSAFLNTGIMAFFESEMPLDKVSSSCCLHSLTSNLLPMPECFDIFIEESICQRIERYAPNIEVLLQNNQNERFKIAITSLWSSSFNPHPPSRMALIWIGIEACFPFKRFKKKNLSQSIPPYLDNNVSADLIESLWDSRNCSVHEGVLPITGDLFQSKVILSSIITRIVEDGQMPPVAEQFQ